MYAEYGTVKLVIPQKEIRMKLGRSLLYLQFPEWGSLHGMQAHRGCAKFWLGGRRQEQEKSLGQSLYFDLGEGKEGLASLNNSHRLWAQGVSKCFVLDPEVL